MSVMLKVMLITFALVIVVVKAVALNVLCVVSIFASVPLEKPPQLFVVKVQLKPKDTVLDMNMLTYLLYHCA